MRSDMSKTCHKKGPQASIAANLLTLKKQLADGCKACGRDPADVKFLAVSKTVNDQRLQQALDLGVRRFGENRVQEAQAKWPPLRQKFPDIELHLIGPLQTNKVKQAVELFDVIETLDRPKLAAHLAKECARTGKYLPLLVQVNIGEEPQKAGISPHDAVNFARDAIEHHGLNVTGMMCIPPLEAPPAPYFALLTKLTREAGLQEISMGMSGDFTIAAQLGATTVRVGSGLFGAREEI